MNDPRSNLLIRLKLTPGMSVERCARFMGMHQTTAGRNLRQMEEQGLIAIAEADVLHNHMRVFLPEQIKSEEEKLEMVTRRGEMLERQLEAELAKFIESGEPFTVNALMLAAGLESGTFLSRRPELKERIYQAVSASGELNPQEKAVAAAQRRERIEEATGEVQQPSARASKALEMEAACRKALAEAIEAGKYFTQADVLKAADASRGFLDRRPELQREISKAAAESRGHAARYSVSASPKLLQEVERLRAENERLRQQSASPVDLLRQELNHLSQMISSIDEQIAQLQMQRVDIEDKRGALSKSIELLSGSVVSIGSQQKLAS